MLGLYLVWAYVQDDCGRSWIRTYGVVGVGQEDVIRAFRQAHPEASLWTISYRAQIETITPDAVYAVVFAEVNHGIAPSEKQTRPASRTRQ